MVAEEFWNILAQVLGLEQVIWSIMMLLKTVPECVSGDSMQHIRLDAVVSKIIVCFFLLMMIVIDEAFHSS